MELYEPFGRGELTVGVPSVQADDRTRDRRFTIEVWYPALEAKRDAAARPGEHPLVVYSHHSGGHRRAATYLSGHLASHGYVVAALDHSEVVAAELVPPTDQ